MKVAMKNSLFISSVIAVIIFISMGNAMASLEDTDRGVLMSSFPYTREVDNDMELARILLIPQRMYHPKRNSELINSLLGLPKNMNNAGRK